MIKWGLSEAVITFWEQREINKKICNCLVKPMLGHNIGYTHGYLSDLSEYAVRKLLEVYASKLRRQGFCIKVVPRQYCLAKEDFERFVYHLQTLWSLLLKSLYTVITFYHLTSRSSKGILGFRRKCIVFDEKVSKTTGVEEVCVLVDPKTGRICREP